MSTETTPEGEPRLSIEDVERFLKRERDEYETRDAYWRTVDDVLNVFRLHMATGTPLTEPCPEQGPEAFGAGKPSLTEAEELRAEVERLRVELNIVRQDAEKWGRVEYTIERAVEKGGGMLDAADLLALAEGEQA